MAADILDAVRMLERQKRLLEGPVEKLYHLTNMDACDGILKTGFRPGTKGEMGPAVYLSQNKPSPGDTKTSRDGCLLTVYVRVGHVLRNPISGCHGYVDPTQKYQPARVLRLGYDTSWAPAGCGTLSPEYAVYFVDQIINATGHEFDKLTSQRLKLVGSATFKDGIPTKRARRKRKRQKPGARAKKEAAATDTTRRRRRNETGIKDAGRRRKSEVEKGRRRQKNDGEDAGRMRKTDSEEGRRRRKDVGEDAGRRGKTESEQTRRRRRRRKET